MERYAVTQKELLQKAWAHSQEELVRALPARWVNDSWEFSALGETCQLRADRIILGTREIIGPEGVLIALYASCVNALEINWHPLKSFKELPRSFASTLYPLPRLGLYYIFYLPDHEFPASVTCLFQANAESFLPIAALADVAEYTVKRIIQLIRLSTS